jgi:hypothetical protein
MGTKFNKSFTRIINSNNIGLKYEDFV